LEPPTVHEITRRLENEGFVKVRQNGSHCQYQKGSRRVTVAGKPSQHLKEGTWKNIKKQAGW
jgi:predicted RNA binding protein YcfA (HicA-like mRNA interferase family)